MATVQDCEQALAGLADRLAASDPSGRDRRLDRTLSCHIRDLDVVFAGRLADGRLVDVHRVDCDGAKGTDGTRGNAQIRLTITADDLVALVDGQLNLASAWATKRVRIDASMMDLVRLRSLL